VLGRLGEQIAASHLQRLGLTIVERNARTRQGEIDLIAHERRTDTLVFVEVKTRRAFPGRRTASGEHPLVSLRARQRVRLRRLAVAWLQARAKTRERAVARTIRFDAVAVVVDDDSRLVSLDHVEAAW
jgi:putative endonuclease